MLKLKSLLLHVLVLMKLNQLESGFTQTPRMVFLLFLR